MFEQRSPWAAFQSFMAQLNDQQQPPQMGAIDTGGVPPNALPQGQPWNNAPNVATPAIPNVPTDYYNQAMANYGRPMANSGMSEIDPRKFDRPQSALQQQIKQGYDPMAAISQSMAGYQARQKDSVSRLKREEQQNWAFK